MYKYKCNYFQLILCRIKPGQSPFWGTWVPRWDFYGLVFNALLRPAVLAIDGSILLNVLYRMIGTRIGKRVFLYGTGFTESDLVCNFSFSTIQNKFEGAQFCGEKCWRGNPSQTKEIIV